MYIHWGLYQREQLFFFDIPINWATNRDWQTKVLDTGKVTLLNLLRQESANTTLKTKQTLSTFGNKANTEYLWKQSKHWVPLKTKQTLSTFENKANTEYLENKQTLSTFAGSHFTSRHGHVMSSDRLDDGGHWDTSAGDLPGVSGCTGSDVSMACIINKINFQCSCFHLISKSDLIIRKQMSFSTMYACNCLCLHP